jgi:hypothetical protein
VIPIFGMYDGFKFDSTNSLPFTLQKQQQMQKTNASNRSKKSKGSRKATTKVEVQVRGMLS